MNAESELERKQAYEKAWDNLTDEQRVEAFRLSLKLGWPLYSKDGGEYDARYWLIPIIDRLEHEHRSIVALMNRNAELESELARKTT